MQITLPKQTQILSCSCSSTGNLWTVSYDGEIYMRTGITRTCPWGTNWILIDSPMSGASLALNKKLNRQMSENSHGTRQIAVGKSTVWALDNKGTVFYRAGVSDDRPQGSKWVKIPATMSYISISSSNQVMTI
jgi:hypothetical protein